MRVYRGQPEKHPPSGPFSKSTSSSPPILLFKNWSRSSLNFVERLYVNSRSGNWDPFLNRTHAVVQNVKSKIAYASDTWTNHQMVYTFACTVVLFIDVDSSLTQRIQRYFKKSKYWLAFKPLGEEKNEGLFGGRVLIHGAKQRGGLDKMIRLHWQWIWKWE